MIDIACTKIKTSLRTKELSFVISSDPYRSDQQCGKKLHSYPPSRESLIKYVHCRLKYVLKLRGQEFCIEEKRVDLDL